MKKLLLLAALGSLMTAGLCAEEKDYQRYDLVRDSNELIVEGGLAGWLENINGIDIYNLTVQAAIEYTFLKNHTVKGSLPYTWSIYNNHELRNKTFYAPGDLTLAYEYLKQIKHLNLFFGPKLSIPLSRTNEYMLREGIYAASDGRFDLGFAVSLTGIRDPVVWNAGFKYDVGLPKKERFYTSWQPGNMQVSAGFSDLFNERFGFSFGVYQNIMLPQINGGEWKSEDLSMSTYCRLEFLILFEKDYVKAAVNAYAFPRNKPFIFELVYGHTFKIPKNDYPNIS
jgi:hypothetical protein